MNKLNFLRFLILTLKSQRGSIGEEEISETDYSDVASIYESLSMDDTSSKNEDADTEVGALDESSSEQPEEDSELTLEQKLEKFELEKSEGDEPDFLSSINQLGITRKGMPIEIESEDQLKELISKGVDYTQKTQELADLRKSYEVELEEREAALSQRESEIESRSGIDSDDKLQNQIFGGILERMKVNDPDTFELIQQEYSQGLNQYKMYSDNPVVNSLKKEIDQLKGLATTMQTTKQSEEFSEIQAEWDTGVKEVSTVMGAKLRGLGIKPDWNSVAKIWSQGEMTVKEALFSAYGEKISSAMEAKDKLNKTKLASQTRRGPEKSFSQEASGKEDSSGDNYVNWLLEKLGT